MADTFTREAPSSDKARIASIHWAHLAAAWRNQGWWEGPSHDPKQRMDTVERILRERYNHDVVSQTSCLAAYQTCGCPAPQDRELTPRLVVERYWPAHDRKMSGAFMTPQTLADQVADHVVQSLGETFSSSMNLLDAASGTGTLGLTLVQHLARKTPTESHSELYATLCHHACFEELDPVLYQAALARWLRHGISLVEQAAPAQACPLPVHHRNSFSQRETHRLILSNPPYLGEKRGRAVLQSLAQLRPRLVSRRHGKSDLLYFFIQHLLDRLEPDGTLVLLTPAYWPTADGARVLRTEILRQLTLERLEFLPPGAFGAHVGVHGMLAIAHKRRSSQRHHPLLVIDGKETKAALEQGRWNDGPWPVRLGSEHAALVETMQGWPHRLGEFFQVKAGVQTGADRFTREHQHRFDIDAKIGQGIFVLSNEERDALWPSLTKTERSLLVPLVKSQSIHPGRIEPSSKPAWLIYLDGKLPMDHLPGLQTHLLPFRPILEQRREVTLGRMPWWRLHWPRRQELFESPHLVCPQRAPIPTFALADKPLYSSVDIYHLSPLPGVEGHLQAWLTYLLSEPVALWLSVMGKRKGPALELYSTPLQAIPVPAKDHKQSPLR